MKIFTGKKEGSQLGGTRMDTDGLRAAIIKAMYNKDYTVSSRFHGYTDDIFPATTLTFRHNGSKIFSIVRIERILYYEETGEIHDQRWTANGLGNPEEITAYVCDASGAILSTTHTVYNDNVEMHGNGGDTFYADVYVTVTEYTVTTVSPLGDHYILDNIGIGTSNSEELVGCIVVQNHLNTALTLPYRNEQVGDLNDIMSRYLQYDLIIARSYLVALGNVGKTSELCADEFITISRGHIMQMKQGEILTIRVALSVNITLTSAAWRRTPLGDLLQAAEVTATPYATHGPYYWYEFVYVKVAPVEIPTKNDFTTDYPLYIWQLLYPNTKLWVYAAVIEMYRGKIDENLVTTSVSHYGLSNKLISSSAAINNMQINSFKYYLDNIFHKFSSYFNTRLTDDIGSPLWVQPQFLNFYIYAHKGKADNLIEETNISLDLTF